MNTGRGKAAMNAGKEKATSAEREKALERKGGKVQVMEIKEVQMLEQQEEKEHLRVINQSM